MPVVKRYRLQWFDEETGDQIAEQFENGKIYIAGGSHDSAGLERLFKSLPSIIAHAKATEEAKQEQLAKESAEITRETGI